MNNGKKRVAIVTGGERGIGLGITQDLLKNGYRVAIFGINEVAAESALESCEEGDDLLFYKCNVGNEEAVMAAVDEVMRSFGRIDAVVCNAGLASARGQKVETLALSDWENVIRTNLSGIFLCAKHTFSELRRRKGAMVLIASTRAFQSEPDSIAYTASKGGVVAMGHSLAISGGPDVRVNVISPGWIDVRKPSRLRKVDHEQHPVGRVGKAEDIADMTTFLLSEKASFITGQNHIVDGGMMKKMIYEH